jgi:hypothetical protein
MKFVHRKKCMIFPYIIHVMNNIIVINGIDYWLEARMLDAIQFKNYYGVN